MANRTAEGELPAGKSIAREYGRSERWGRLVKQAGLAGHLDPISFQKIASNSQTRTARS